MATDPRIPETLQSEGKRPQGVMKTPRPKSGVRAVILALIVAALLLAAVIYFMPRAPKATPPPAAAEVPSQPTGSAIQVSRVTMTPDPTGNSLYIQGMMTNAGSQTINGAVMHVIFHGTDGRVLGDMNSPVESVSAGKGGSEVAHPLTTEPLKPNDTRPFRVGIDHVPQGWNHRMPEVRISEVTSHP